MVITTEERKAPPLYTPPLSASMSLEDVVKYYGDEERKRRRGEDEREAGRRHFSGMITELSSSVKVVAARMGVSLVVLTRCMARHSLCWYQEVLGLDDLKSSYWDVFMAAKQGHTVVRKQMEQINFESLLPYESGDTWWDIPNFTAIQFGNWRASVSAETYTMLIYGFAWSLTTLEHREWDKYNIETYFSPEVKHLEKMLAYRRVDLDAFQSKLRVDEDFAPKT